MKTSKKPIAKVLVLDGPTHFLTLPVAGQVAFSARTSVPIYSAEDLAFVKGAIPAGQMRVREFPRMLDAPPAPKSHSVAPLVAKTGRGRSGA